MIQIYTYVYIHKQYGNSIDRSIGMCVYINTYVCVKISLYTYIYIHVSVCMAHTYWPQDSRPKVVEAALESRRPLV